jgi:hypothetical protein
VIALKYLVLCVALIAWLSVIGYPLRRVLDRPGGGPLAPVPAPFVGMAVVQVVGWYWFEAGGHGLRAPAIALTAIATVATLATTIRDQRRRRRADRARLALCGGTLVGAALVLALNFSAVLGLGFVTTADSGNNDAASYAVVADHLARKGFDAIGPVAGYDLGTEARQDGFGSTVVLGSFAAATDLPTVKLNEAVLFSFTALAIYSLALLLRELLQGQDALALTASVAAACTLLFIYIVTHFFLGQLMAMGVLPLLALIGLRAAAPAPSRERWALVAASTIVFVTLFSHYSHMAIFAPPVVLPGALLASTSAHLSVGELWARLGRMAGAVGGGFVGAVVLTPTLVWLGLQNAIERSGVVAGWPLPGFLPIELMGFLRQVTPLPSAARILWSVAVLVTFGAAAWLARSSHRVAVRFSVTTVAVILVSYFLVFRRDVEPTYEQWKWITFFQPLFVAAVLTTTLLGLRAAIGRWWRGPTVAILCAAAAGFGVLVSTNTGDGEGTALRDHRRLAAVGPDAFDLGVNPALRNLDRVNIGLAPYWDSMWATYFLSDKSLRLQEKTYWTIRPPAPGWTLIPTSVDLSGETVRPVNASYRLLRTSDGPTSTTADGLDAAVQVTLEPTLSSATVVTGTARVTNTGTTAWLPSNGRLGSVNLGIRLSDATGTIVDDDYARISLNPSLQMAIPPRTTVTVLFSIPAPPEPAMELVFQPVAELVAWFGPQVRGTDAGAP